MTSSAIHHLHKRKRIHQKHEKYPHPDKWKNRLDLIVFGIGLFAVFMTIPQVIEVWTNKNVAGVSPATWITYALASFCWMIYGVVHKEDKIVVVNALYVVLNLLVVAGVWVSIGHLAL
ncbi:hypothetical protein HY988_00660 [Candidatus Micrarchaeota archaeon]|nr:hypothetical protein [Candidatus Micrarchaeota archaeon]